ncbi:MAG: pyridoxal-phosphate dependent enzyme, partial [Gaiellaceae bacterium]
MTGARSSWLTLGEGDTPLVRAPRLSAELGVDLLLKCEFLNPTGSFKDRGMAVAVERAADSGARAV